MTEIKEKNFMIDIVRSVTIILLSMGKIKVEEYAL